jgi:hypothetical protein
MSVNGRAHVQRMIGEGCLCKQSTQQGNKRAIERQGIEEGETWDSVCIDVRIILSQ